MLAGETAGVCGMRRRLTALSVLFSVGLGNEASFAQSGSDIINISAAWFRPPSARPFRPNGASFHPPRFLHRRKSSSARHVDRAIGPAGLQSERIRLADARRSCRSSVAQNPPNFASSPGVISIYAVDGLSLGAKVSFESSIYRQYQCSPSEQFDGFSWCARKVPESTKRGPFTSSYSILHSRDGTVSYVNRSLEPAWFSGNEAKRICAACKKIRRPAQRDGHAAT